MQVIPAAAKNAGSLSLLDERPARLGQISFINSLPVVLPVERGQIEVNAEVHLDSPARLNAMYAAGLLDIGAMSSFYFLQCGNFRLLPSLSISCLGPVGSVLFFSKHAAGKLGGKKILVSSQSATSVNLLRILLLETAGISPFLLSADLPDLSEADVDGCLVIGDRALAVDEIYSRRYLRLDLGEWWFNTFQLPMVFGVWAAEAGWAERHSQCFADLTAALSAAKDLGLSSMFADVLSEAKKRSGLQESRLAAYFRSELNFDFSDSHRKGLALYGQLARKHGLLLACPKSSD